MAKIGDYESATRPHRERAKQIRSLIEQVLHDAGVTVHSVTHRVKTEGSATAKIKASPDRYGSYGDLHDLLGLRVITHLVTEVDAVVRVLRREFDVDEQRSVDKAADLNVDEFGYRSFHLVVKLRDERNTLPEWRAFAGIYFEIQVRSILQHAWAEIEHDLGYKPSVGVPDEISRRFARLAGLLEIADDEFDRLTKDALAHARKTDAAVKRGRNVAVDRDSIHALVTSAGPVRDADLAVAERAEGVLMDSPSVEYSNLRAKELREVGLETIDDVTREMRRLGPSVAKFAAAWLRYGRHSAEELGAFDYDSAHDDVDTRESFSPGISLFYLSLHRRLVQQGDTFESVPTHSDDDLYDSDDDENAHAAFRQLHDEIFGSGVL